MAGACSSLPLEQKSTSLEVGEEDLPPGVPSDAESSLSHEPSTEFDMGGQAAATRTKSGHRRDPSLGAEGLRVCMASCSRGC